MENMNTIVTIINLEDEEKRRETLLLLEKFDSLAVDGVLRLGETDKVFVVKDSEADLKLRGEDTGKVYSLGSVEIGGRSFSQYCVNESLFFPR